jgi:aspartate dehydrogenase
MLRIGIVGAGTMGLLIARAVAAGEVHARLVAVSDLDVGRARALADSLARVPIVASLRELAREADLIVESAGASAVADVLSEAIAAERDALILSVGGLIDLGDLIERAGRAGTTIHCPSGAIAGLDAVRAAAIGTIESARITTRKPPAGLVGAPYLAERGVDLSSLTTPTVVFEGSARDACRAFPANVNVSAALALAGIGVDRTRVRLVADPGVTRNTHEIEVRGDFGVLRTSTENVPSENPRTSLLAARSAIALLRNLTATLRIGA